MRNHNTPSLSTKSSVKQKPGFNYTKTVHNTIHINHTIWLIKVIQPNTPVFKNKSENIALFIAFSTRYRWSQVDWPLSHEIIKQHNYTGKTTLNELKLILMNKSRKINIKIHIISWDSALKYFTQFILQVRAANQNGGDRQRSTSLYANDPPTRLHCLEAREANSNSLLRRTVKDWGKTDVPII